MNQSARTFEVDGRPDVAEISKSRFQMWEGVSLLDNVSLVDHHNHNRHILKEVSFKVCEGEIVGIAGVDENGQKELAEIICGLRKATSGEIRMLGKDVTHATTRQLIEMGMSYIPADRRNQGLVMNFPSERRSLNHYSTIH